MNVGFRKPQFKGKGIFTPPPGCQFINGQWVRVSSPASECNGTIAPDAPSIASPTIGHKDDDHQK